MSKKPFIAPIRILLYLCIPAWLLIGSGCQSSAKPAGTVSDLAATDRILVVAFRDMNTESGEPTSVRCPLSGKMYLAGPVSAKAETLLTNELMRRLQANPQFKLITAETLWQLQSGQIEEGETLSERRLLVETGKRLQADYVLAGHVYRYNERIGGNFSVDTPASVAFDIHLLRVSDGRVIWNGAFDETQKPLTEDLFQLDQFIKREGKWTTAEEMSKTGMQEIMSRFPYRMGSS